MLADAIGLDIGGANLKAATASGRAVSTPFELWRNPDGLAGALRQLVEPFGDLPVAVTMTGELCDCFPTKRDGVRRILASVAEAFPGRSLRVWSTEGFVGPGLQREAQARDAESISSLACASGWDELTIAAANWHAQATFVGRFAPHGLAVLIDTGSTTTDIIPILDGRPVPTGQTDPERLRSGELVYTGVRRTPICAVIQEGVAAEWFATTHDAYVFLGHLPEQPKFRGTADGRPMTRAFARARMARMLGGDAETTSGDEVADLAQRTIDRQREQIASRIQTVAVRVGGMPVQLLTSGSGEILAQMACQTLTEQSGLPCTTMSLGTRLGGELSEAACAYAVAKLLLERGP